MASAPIRQNEACGREDRPVTGGNVKGVLQPHRMAGGQLLLLSGGGPCQEEDQYHSKWTDASAGAALSKAHAYFPKYGYTGHGSSTVAIPAHEWKRLPGACYRPLLLRWKRGGPPSDTETTDESAAVDWLLIQSSPTSPQPPPAASARPRPAGGDLAPEAPAARARDAVRLR